jgi:hypothetical protein
MKKGRQERKGGGRKRENRSARESRQGRGEKSAPLSVNNEDPLVLEANPLVDVAEHRALVLGIGFPLTSGALVGACRGSRKERGGRGGRCQWSRSEEDKREKEERGRGEGGKEGRREAEEAET